jgi:preprotein translocase subunit YajC
MRYLIILILPLMLYAQQERGGGGLFAALLPLLFLFAIFYFLLILPQSRQEKKRKAMIASLKRGDRVVTTGGIIGTITKIDENTITLRVSQNTTLKLERNAVKAVLKQEREEISD